MAQDDFGFVPTQNAQELDDGLGFQPAPPDTSAMKDHVATNLSRRPKREAIDTAVKPVPAEDFLDSLAAGWGTGVVSITQHAPIISPNDHLNRMDAIGNMLGQAAGDLPAMWAGAKVGAAIGAPIGGLAGSVVPGLGTLGGIGLGAAIAGGAGAWAAPAGIRKLMIEQYEKGPIKDSADFMNRLSAASYEALKGGAVGAVTGGAGYGANLLSYGIGAKPLTAELGSFATELSTMATASAAMEQRLPNYDDFLNAGIVMAGFHGANAAASKMMGIFKATAEMPHEIGEAASTDPKLRQEMISNNPDLPKIEVPSLEEQEALGLKNLTEEEIQGGAKFTDEQRQALDAIEVAKEAAEAQKPKDELDEELDAPSARLLSDDEKAMARFVGADDVPKDDSAAGAFKRDLVNFWKTEDTKGNGDGFESELGGKIMDEFSNFWINRFDFTAGLKKAMKAVLADPATERNPQRLALLHSEVMTKVETFLEKYTVDFKTGDANGESYDSIVADYKKAFPDDPKMDGLRLYGMARRVVEKDEQGMKIIVNGEQIDPELAQRIVDAGEDKFEALNQRRIAYRKRVLQFAHDSGYWTPKEFQAIIGGNEQYMSFHRLQELDPVLGKLKGGTAAVKRMKGVGGLIVDPLVSDLKDTMVLIKMAQENRIKRAMVDTLATDNDDAFLRRVETDMRPIQVSGQEIESHLKAQGIEHDQDTISALTVFRPEQKRLGNQRMEVHVDGERRVYEGDQQTIDIANRLRGNPQASSMFANMLKLAATGIRAGTINAWAFFTKHSFRNQITGGTYSESGMLPVVGPAMYAAEFFSGKSQRLNDFYYDGGAQSSYVAFDERYIQSRIFEMDKKAPFMDKAFNQVQTAAQLSHSMILNNDNLIRFTEYARLREQGRTREDAAYGARRVLPDVQTAGLINSFLLQQTAFLGIHAKGMMRQAEAIGDQIQQSKAALENGNIPDALKGPIARSIGMITVPAAMLAAANLGSERIDRLEPWQKYGYFNWAHSDWQKATPEEAAGMPHEDLKRLVKDEDGTSHWEIDNGVTWRMQMPFTQGVFFGGLVQSTLDAWKKKSPKPFAEWAANVAESTTALPIPNFAQPIIAQVTNYNAFTGRPVIPDNKLQLAPELQYEPYTTDTAKAIGKLIGSVPYLGDVGPAHQKLASPMIVEEYVRDFTGPIGMGALRLADYAFEKATGKKPVESPQWEWGDYPVIGAFCWRNDTAKTADIDEFLDQYAKASSNTRSAKELDKEGLSSEQFRDAHAQEMFKMSGPYKAIHNMKQYIHSITANPDLTGVDKRQLIEPVFYRMDEIAKDANRQMEEFRKTAKQAGRN